MKNKNRDTYMMSVSIWDVVVLLNAISERCDGFFKIVYDSTVSVPKDMDERVALMEFFNSHYEPLRKLMMVMERKFPEIAE